MVKEAKKIAQPPRDNTKQNLGHRGRVRERVIKSGADALHDYELLEALLYYVFPRGDTKTMAKNLLKQMGSLKKIGNASAEDFADVVGAGPSTILFFQLLKELSLRISYQEAFHDKPLLHSWAAVVEYCRKAIGFEKLEHFMVLYLDSNRRLISHEIMSKGTISRVNVYVRNIVTDALKHNASAVILVHNHPTDRTEPSKPDIDITKAIIKALRTVDIVLHDHIIIGPTNYDSFKNLGLIT